LIISIFEIQLDAKIAFSNISIYQTKYSFHMQCSDDFTGYKKKNLKGFQKKDKLPTMQCIPT